MRHLKDSIRRLGLAAIVALVLSTASARANSSENTFHFLSVGVSKYANLPARGQLRYAHRDAEDLAKVWRAQDGRLYGKVVGETLLDTDATLRNIVAALDRMIQTARSGDVAVISLSGHGGFNAIRDPNWYFTPHDYRPEDMPGTALGTNVLRAKLTALGERGATVILILDACHSGGYGGSEGNVVVLASCLPHQLSQEHPSWSNGAYTKALLEAFQGLADTDRDGTITLAELDAYVTTRVVQLLLQANGANSRPAQHPTSAKPTSVRNALPLAHVVAPVSSRAGL